MTYSFETPRPGLPDVQWRDLLSPDERAAFNAREREKRARLQIIAELLERHVEAGKGVQLDFGHDAAVAFLADINEWRDHLGAA